MLVGDGCKYTDVLYLIQRLLGFKYKQLRHSLYVLLFISKHVYNR